MFATILNPISELQHAPLPPQSAINWRVCPDSLLFSYFQFGFTFESIKELGSASHINVPSMIIKENVMTKAIDKMRFTKYNKILVKGTLKTTHIPKHVHSAFQNIKPISLDTEPCVVCGNWFPYMDIETTSCGHLHHFKCLYVNLQDSAHCNKCG